MGSSRSPRCNRRWLGRIAFVRINDATVAKGESTLGIESNRLVIIRDGSVYVAFVSISDAPVPKGVSAFGIELDRLVKIGDGSVYVAFVCISDAPVAESESLLGSSRIASL